MLSTSLDHSQFLARLYLSLSMQLSGLTQRPRFIVQKVSNLWLCFTFMSEEKVVVENMGPEGSSQVLSTLLHSVWYHFLTPLFLFGLIRYCAWKFEAHFGYVLMSLAFFFLHFFWLVISL